MELVPFLGFAYRSYFWLKVIHRHEVGAKATSAPGSTPKCCLKGFEEFFPRVFKNTHPFFACGTKLGCRLFSQGEF